MVHHTQVFIRPVVTEKTVAQKEKFVFQVHTDATKGDVEKALKEFYGITPIKINIVNLPEKTRMVRRGVESRKRSPFKKAVVTVKKGETIDFNAFK
jgi:large subunit ribosomal protein L23